MKILVVKTSSLGDVIHALPALTDARAALPDLAVDWVVEPAFADVVRLHPGVRRVWPAPIRQWRRRAAQAATWHEILALRRALRAEAYDLVIDAQGLVKSAAVAALAGAPIAGLDRASARGGLVSAVYDRRYAVLPDLHAIDRVRLLFGAVLGYEPDLGPPDAGLARAGGAGPVDPCRALLLHGTTWPTKRWPLAQWVALAKGLRARGYRAAATFADAEEERRVRELVAAVPTIEVVPRQTIGGLLGLVGQSALVVGVDTGLTHLAAALGRPTIALFASTAPGKTEPRGPHVAVLAASTPCAPCGKRRCMVVPAHLDPPCHATIGPGRALAQVDTWTADGTLARPSAVASPSPAGRRPRPLGEQHAAIASAHPDGTSWTGAIRPQP